MIQVPALNYYAILVASAFYLAAGFVWYTFLPGKAWDKETAGTPPSGSNPVLPVLGFAIASFLNVFGVAFILAFYGAGAPKGVIISLFALVCFILPINSLHLVFTEKRNLYFIEAGFQVVRAAAIGAILGFWT
jgi:hypothetical protein